MSVNSDTPRTAPVQGFSAGIPWDMHLRAYDAYCKRHGPQPALIEGWCRGGFGVDELDVFIPGWRDELSVRAKLERELAQAMAELATMTERYNVAAMNALDATAELAKVAAARGQAEAENKALREDAERYRLLRSPDVGVEILAKLARNAYADERFDAVVDAARKKP